MIGRDIVVLLQNEAKRRPIVAELLARVTTLTDAEIDAADVPMKWYKDALREARRRMTAHQVAEEIKRFSDAEAAVSVPTGANDKSGVTLEYVGENFWVPARRGFQIEVASGDWIFFPHDGGAWLNQTFIDNPPMKFQQSKKIADQTRHEYVLAYQNRLLGKATDQTPTIDLTPSSGPTRPQHRGFTIQRH